MAEIHIEKKDRNIWPWVIGALLLALLLWFFLARPAGRTDGMVGVGDDTTTAAAATAATGDTGIAGGTGMAAVNELSAYAERSPGAEPGREHAYTAEGLRLVAAALEEVGRGADVVGADVQRRAQEIRERADSLEREPTSNRHALLAREAVLVASGTIGQLQQNRGIAAAQTGGADEAAKRINATQPLLEQIDAVQGFFREAAMALRNLSQNR